VSIAHNLIETISRWRWNQWLRGRTGNIQA